MKQIILGILLAVSFGVCAETTLPAGCKSIAVRGDEINVQFKKPKLVIIHNITSNDMWLTHPVSDPGASAGWTSKLQSDNWSALFVHKSPFSLNCVESKPGHEQQIPCKGAVSVCRWKKPKHPKDINSTFWVGENQSLPSLKAILDEKGFVL